MLRMPKPARTWTCSACGEAVENELMVVLRHQLAHVWRRPFAALLRKHEVKPHAGSAPASELEQPDLR